jgi:hypothetical protein
MSFVPIRKYNDNQVIITSDRLIFNSRKDNVFISAKKDLAVSVEGDVHINTDNSFLLNAGTIKLGINKVQPIPKGDDLNNMHTALIRALDNLAVALQGAIGIGVGTVSQPSINAAGATLKGELTNIKDLIDKINSKVTFTS